MLGFDVPDSGDQRALRAIAEATGGTYTNAADAGALNRYVADQVARQRDLVSSWYCLVQARNLHTISTRNLHNRARMRLQNATVAVGAQEDESLRALIARVEGERDRRIAEVEALVGPHVDEVQRQLQTALQRYEERYGEDLGAFVPSTPGLLVAARGDWRT